MWSGSWDRSSLVPGGLKPRDAIDERKSRADHAKRGKDAAGDDDEVQQTWPANGHAQLGAEKQRAATSPVLAPPTSPPCSPLSARRATDISRSWACLAREGIGSDRDPQQAEDLQLEPVELELEDLESSACRVAQHVA